LRWGGAWHYSSPLAFSPARDWQEEVWKPFSLRERVRD
jgi:hypothetical protein